MLILGIDTSTHVCSVALSEHGETLDFIENAEGMLHASVITVQIKELLERNQYRLNQLEEKPSVKASVLIQVCVSELLRPRACATL